MTSRPSRATAYPASEDETGLAFLNLRRRGAVPTLTYGEADVTVAGTEIPALAVLLAGLARDISAPWIGGPHSRVEGYCPR